VAVVEPPPARVRPVDPRPAAAPPANPAPPPVSVPATPIAAPPVVRTFTPTPEPSVAAPQETWEVVVGTNWLNKIGVVVFIIGVALLVGYSMVHVGPLGRVAIG